MTPGEICAQQGLITRVSFGIISEKFLKQKIRHPIRLEQLAAELTAQIVQRCANQGHAFIGADAVPVGYKQHKICGMGQEFGPGIEDVKQEIINNVADSLVLTRQANHVAGSRFALEYLVSPLEYKGQQEMVVWTMRQYIPNGTEEQQQQHDSDHPNLENNEEVQPNQEDNEVQE
jgi:hypothetical protein